MPRFSASQAKVWRDAARAAGLRDLAVSVEGLSGRVGPLQVLLSRYDTGPEHGSRVRVFGLPPELTIEPEGHGGSGTTTREIEVGDEAFDRAAWVEGPPALVRSLLDADTRRALARLFEGRLDRPRLQPFWAEGQLTEGVLHVDMPEAAPPTRSNPLNAVLPLKEAEREDSALRAAARQAIAEIQARLAGAAPGQLSLAGAESGALSLADDRPGRLSLAPPGTAASARGAQVGPGDERSAGAETADPSGPVQPKALGMTGVKE